MCTHAAPALARFLRFLLLYARIVLASLKSRRAHVPIRLNREESEMAKTVIGLVQNTNEAQQVVDELLKSGFERDQIGILSTELAQQVAELAKNTRKGIGLGALGGLALAGVTLLIPGVGTALAIGPAATLLAGGAIGAVAGGLIKALTARGMPEEKAHFYAEGVRRGGTLITAHAKTDALAKRAVEILKKHGAKDIDTRSGEWKKLGWSGLFAVEPPPEKAGPVEAEPLTDPAAEEPVELAAVEVFEMVIELPEAAEAANQPAYHGPNRRSADQPYKGQDRRKAA
jgi:hypothetical protein